MENPEKVILTNMCMIFSGTKLLVQEKVGKGFKGFTCPGGHVEPDEPIVDSVIREIQEETGLTIKAANQEHSEIFLDPADNWKPVLK